MLFRFDCLFRNTFTNFYIWKNSIFIIIICIIFTLAIYWLDGFSYLGLGRWWNNLAIVQKIRIGDIRPLG